MNSWKTALALEVLTQHTLYYYEVCTWLINNIVCFFSRSFLVSCRKLFVFLPYFNPAGFLSTDCLKEWGIDRWTVSHGGEILSGTFQMHLSELAVQCPLNFSGIGMPNSLRHLWKSQLLSGRNLLIFKSTFYWEFVNGLKSGSKMWANSDLLCVTKIVSDIMLKYKQHKRMFLIYADIRHFF